MYYGSYVIRFCFISWFVFVESHNALYSGQLTAVTVILFFSSAVYVSIVVDGVAWLSQQLMFAWLTEISAGLGTRRRVASRRNVTVRLSRGSFWLMTVVDGWVIKVHECVGKNKRSTICRFRGKLFTSLTHSWLWINV